MIVDPPSSGAGLSPRLRGNLLADGDGHRPLRSIPAPAGEPVVLMGGFLSIVVYPRACGGTQIKVASNANLDGLSPRLRGNLEQHGQIPKSARSIPAPAGEPPKQWNRLITAQVYPRACGGTLPVAILELSSMGLSPRLRGNRPGEKISSKAVGSIPAPAGEPPVPSGCRRGGPVYPRACGGTLLSASGFLPRFGLSPRLRGNRLMPPPIMSRDGSIPAPAGEPSAAGTRCGWTRVYPRACGGTVLSHRALPPK